jgi:hypothetical protein
MTTADVDAEPAGVLSPAESRARWAHIRELNRRVLADRAAAERVAKRIAAARVAERRARRPPRLRP